MTNIASSQMAIFQIASMYENYNGDYSFFKKYCDSNEITYGLICFYLNLVDIELQEIKKIEEDYMYEKQIETQFSIIPKKQSIVVSRDFIDESLNVTEKHFINAPFNMLDYFMQTTITAYKFEMLYCKQVLDRILTEIDLEIEEIE